MNKLAAKLKTLRKIEILMIGITIIYLISILWLNFHAKPWYVFDMYSDMYVAELMSEQKTFFPENWIFGNQYYIVATPVLASIIYGICHNGFISMAIASCLMTVFIIVSFVYCIFPIFKKSGFFTGALMILGGGLLGSSAAGYICGFQCLYTMASYYSCYLIGILLTLGVYLRCKFKKPCSFAICIIVLLLNFSLGMHSPREMLILNIPLLIMEGFSAIGVIAKKKNLRFVFEKNKALYFAVSAFAANLCGMILIKVLNIKSNLLIDPIRLETNPSNLFNNFKGTLSSFLSISGLDFVLRGVKWYPLFVFAVFLFCGVFAAIIIIFKKKDNGWLASIIIFVALSIICVGGVGVFLMRVRPLYFFVWYVLSAFSWMYLTANIKHKFFKTALLALCAFSVLNYICNFYPVFSEYEAKNAFYENVEQYLEEQGIEYVYVDYNTSPTVAVYSDEKIKSGTVRFNLDAVQNEELMTAIEYLKPTDIWEQNSENSCVMFSNWTFDYLERAASREYVDKLMSTLTLEKEFDFGSTEKRYIYRISEPIIEY